MPQLQYYPVRETLFSAAEQGVPQLAFIPDVSCDEIFGRGLADRFTRHQLSPCHFLDAVLDSLC